MPGRGRRALDHGFTLRRFWHGRGFDWPESVFWGKSLGLFCPTGVAEVVRRFPESGLVPGRWDGGGRAGASAGCLAHRRCPLAKMAPALFFAPD